MKISNRISIEVGNSSIKYGNNELVANRMRSYEERDSFNQSISTIEIENMKYVIGEGEGPTSLQSKYQPAMLPMYLYAISNTFPDIQVIECDINCLLPILQVTSKKQELKELLVGTHEFIMNGEYRKVVIESVYVYPEGIVVLNHHNKGDMLLLDIGHKTINMCVVFNNSIVDVSTIEYGLEEVSTMVNEFINSNYSITPRNIDTVTIEGSFVYRGKTIELPMERFYKTYVHRAIEKIGTKVDFNQNYQIHIIGGGYFLADLFIEEKEYLSVTVGHRFSNLAALKLIR